MKLKYMLLCLPLLLSVTARADDDQTDIPYDDIYLKDGSMYHGYVSEQTLTGEVKIVYDWAVFKFDRAKLQIVPEEDPYVIISAANQNFGKCTILEDGDVITFKQLAGGTHTTKASNIEKTVRPVTPGIYDILETRGSPGRSYRGHLVEIGKYYKLMQDNGVPVVLKQENIVVQKREREEKSLSLFSQSPFLERYVMKNGAEFRGVLTSRSFTEGTLVLMDATDIPIPVNLGQVRGIFKEPNRLYHVEPDRLEEFEVRVNGKVFEGIEPTINKNVVTVPSDGSLPFVVAKFGEPLIVEVDESILGPNPDVSPYMLSSMKPAKEGEEFYRIVLNKPKDKDSYRIVPDSNVKKGHTVQYVYDRPLRGIYALLRVDVNPNAKHNKILFIWVD